MAVTVVVGKRRSTGGLPVRTTRVLKLGGILRALILASDSGLPSFMPRSRDIPYPNLPKTP